MAEGLFLGAAFCRLFCAMVSSPWKNLAIEHDQRSKSSIEIPARARRGTAQPDIAHRSQNMLTQPPRRRRVPSALAQHGAPADSHRMRPSREINATDARPIIRDLMKSLTIVGVDSRRVRAVHGAETGRWNWIWAWAWAWAGTGAGDRDWDRDWERDLERDWD